MVNQTDSTVHWKLVKNISSHALNKCDVVEEILSNNKTKMNRKFNEFCTQSSRFMKEAFLIGVWILNHVDKNKSRRLRKKGYERVVQENYEIAKYLVESVQNQEKNGIFYILLIEDLYFDRLVKDIKLWEGIQDTLDSEIKKITIKALLDNDDLHSIDTVRKIIWKKAGLVY